MNARSLATETATSRPTQLFFMSVRHFGDEHMQDISHLIRNLFLVGLVSVGAPIAGCTIVEDDEPDVQLHSDVDDDDVELDDDVEIEVDD
jgi:hypothetical protein